MSEIVTLPVVRIERHPDGEVGQLRADLQYWKENANYWLKRAEALAAELNALKAHG